MYWSTLHSIGNDIPFVQNLPTGQIMHVFEEVDLNSKEYVPVLHRTGAVMPAFAQKEPTGHGRQNVSERAPAVAEKDPAAHNDSFVDP
jgi:hypothetical protein